MPLRTSFLLAHEPASSIARLPRTNRFAAKGAVVERAVLWLLIAGTSLVPVFVWQ